VRFILLIPTARREERIIGVHFSLALANHRSERHAGRTIVSSRKSIDRLLGFKSFSSAEATLAGIELHHIIRKGQLKLEEVTPFGQFYALAG
jgi:transposase-like protein